MVCPVCSRQFNDPAELQAHVNAHFDSPAPAQPQQLQEQQACPRCGELVPPADADSHALAHQLLDEDAQHAQQQAVAAAGDEAAARAAAEEWDAAAACQAAEDWDAQVAAEVAAGDGGSGGEGDDEAAADAAHRAQLEDLYFQELRARYGFTQAPRAGCCHICGEEGHWARDCQRNPEVQEAQRRIVRPPTPAAIAASQRPASPTALPGGAGLIALLAACLRDQTPQAAPAGEAYRAALCGEVEHFGTTLFSSGWGCGWNNTQAMASHLLAARPEARAALFGGAGWVPDIPALQAWLEAAWQAGFDRQGAEQLGGQVQGTQKWIGTTECAALLRSFGVRAHIVDFGVSAADAAASAQLAAAAAAAAAADTSPGGSGGSGGRGAGGSGSGGKGRIVGVHTGVECDGCGQCPILGDRWKSQAHQNYDLCAACHAKGASPALEPFTRMLPAAMTAVQQQAQQGQGGGGGGGGNAGGSNGGGASPVRDSLLQWVWRYFTESDASGQPGSSGGDGGAGEGGAAAAPAAKRPRLAAPLRVLLSGKSPLYFQHEGHSRTIVGIERRLVGREQRVEFTLLVLDPSTDGAKLASALGARRGWQRFLKRGARTLRQAQFQLLYCAPGLAAAGGAELAGLKLVAASERQRL